MNLTDNEYPVHKISTNNPSEGDVYLIGVKHSSQSACDTVNAVFDDVDPNTLGLEFSPFEVRRIQRQSFSDVHNENMLALEKHSGDYVVGLDLPRPLSILVFWRNSSFSLLSLSILMLIQLLTYPLFLITGITKEIDNSLEGVTGRDIFNSISNSDVRRDSSIRDSIMSARLTDARKDGVVVAVVGLTHMNEIEKRISGKVTVLDPYSEEMVN